MNDNEASSGGGKILQVVTRNDSKRPVVIAKIRPFCQTRNCFTTDYFKGCLDVLLLQDEMENIQTWIKQLHGADPGV